MVYNINKIKYSEVLENNKDIINSKNVFPTQTQVDNSIQDEVTEDKLERVKEDILSGNTKPHKKIKS